jgi:hypothetical protein
VVLAVSLIVVPLAVSSVLGDQFTEAKWYVLELLSVVWIVGHTATRPVRLWSGLGRRHAAVLSALAALTAANSLRSGFAWAVGPLLARAAFAAMTFCAYVCFSRNGRHTRVVEAALATSCAVVTSIGLAQVLGLTRAVGLEPLFGLTSGDGRSATFGNANMAAQFVGFALVFLVATASPSGDRREGRRLAARGVLVATGFVYIVLLGARSAVLGTAAAFVVVAALSRPRVRAVPRRWLVLTAAAALAGTVTAAWIAAGGVQQGDGPSKARSVEIRLALVEQTLKLVRGHPLGVGAGNFFHSFLPYQLGDERLRSESIAYASPHNELLRALAEEGVVWCALAAWLLLALALAVLRRARREAWPSAAVAVAAGGAFLFVESLFQFPFALASGALAGAMLLGLALAYAGPAEPDGTATHPTAIAWRVAFAAAACAALFGLARLVESDYRASAASDPRELSRASDLNPRNTRATLKAAWFDARAGHRRRARVRLAGLLERSPYYYPAIKLLAEESLRNGDARAGCLHLWVYDVLFAGRSSVHDRLADTCDPGLLEGFRRHVTVPGYERFPLAVPEAGPEEF